MTTALLYVLAVLAVYRLAYLIALEEGPAEIFVRLRTALGAYDYGENGEPTTNLGRGISCPLCVGMWVALLIAPLVLWPSPWGVMLLTWLGLAGGQMLLAQFIE